MSGRDPLGGAGAGLRQVVDALWAPGRTGVTVDVGAGAPAENRCLERYWVLPHPRWPRLLLPADDLAAARRAVGNYRGLRTARAEAWSVAIRAGVLSTRFAAGRLAQLRVSGDADALRLLPRLGGLVGAERVRAMLAVRKAGPHTKPTIGLLDETGRPVGYAKIGCSPLTDAMVRNEAATLRAIEGRMPSIVRPALVAESDWLDHPVAVLGPLPVDARRLDTEPFEMASALWEVAASSGVHEAPFRGSSYADRLERRLGACRVASPDVVSALADWLDALAASDEALRFGRSHGDWVSWNLGRSRGRVVAWDWERSVPDAPIGFDACHWYFQRGREKGGLEVGVAAVDEIAPGLTRVGVPADDCARVADLYLVSAFVAEMESATSPVVGPLATVAGIARDRARRLRDDG